MNRSSNLASPFHQHSVNSPKALALSVGDRSFSYGELATAARRVAGWIQSTQVQSPARIGVLSSRSAEALIGILGSLWSGAAYVPIDARTPKDRIVSILQSAGVTALIVDEEGLKILSEEILRFAPKEILAATRSKPQLSRTGDSQLCFTRLEELPEAGPDEPVSVPGDSLAYILFTSGTTGTPKGVMVETGAISHLLCAAQDRAPLYPADRMALSLQLTFDASILALFSAWRAGASVHVVPAEQLLAPGRYFAKMKITTSILVPSMGMFMYQLGMLKPGSYPDFRQVVFGGEGLPLSLAKAWREAAPNCRIDNHYGPTEASVSCIWQQYTEPPLETPGRGTLAIGKPVPGIDVDVVDAELNSVGCDKPGELIVTGPQLARGYLNDSEKNRVSFPTVRGRRWYRTGDLGYRDEAGVYHHLGRIDNQVKILGNRVELDEIEAHLRHVVRDDMVAAVAWPLVNNNATSIVAFHCNHRLTRDHVREAMKAFVPDYMIPHRVYCLDTMPLGPTGKIDRKTLVHLLDKGAFDSHANNTASLCVTAETY